MATKMLSRAFGALVAAAVLTLVGCGASFDVRSPPGFVELEDQEPRYQYRSTSADGVVIGVREFEHKPKGDQDFWVKAIKNRMREIAGYALLEEVQVTTKSGLKGTQVRFGHDLQGDPMLYTMTVFVTDDAIYLVEFGGSREQMTRQAQHLAWVIDNFRLT